MKMFIPLMILLALVSCQGNKSSSNSEERSQNAVENETVNKFMELVNNHRRGKGLKSLTHVNSLADIAHGHSRDMARKSVSFGHSGFFSRCTDARTVMDGGNLCAENVAMGQKTAEAVFKSWMNSSSHRANLENPRLTHCGLGLALSSSGTHYWTHFFLEKN